MTNFISNNISQSYVVIHRMYLLLLMDLSNGVKVRQTMNLPYPEFKKSKVAVEEKMETPISIIESITN